MNHEGHDDHEGDSTTLLKYHAAMTRDDLLAFMRFEKYAVQASVSPTGTPQSAVVGIAISDDFEIFFDTLDTSRKAKNLRTNGAVAFVIGGTRDGDERTVQYEGVADEPTGELDSQTASEIFGVLRALNQELNVTVVIVTHDPAIANQIDRIVAIRDGRISTESFRRIGFHGREAYVYHDEFAVVDRSGRLQIPKEYLERLDVKERARLRLAEDHVEVMPEEPAEEEERR